MEAQIIIEEIIFGEIIDDIYKQIRSIHYEDTEKQIMLAQILLNFLKMSKDFSTYTNIISLLEEKEKKEQSNSKQ